MRIIPVNGENTWIARAQRLHNFANHALVEHFLHCQVQHRLSIAQLARQDTTVPPDRSYRYLAKVDITTTWKNGQVLATA
jgi:hypothetical protein